VLTVSKMKNKHRRKAGQDNVVVDGRRKRVNTSNTNMMKKKKFEEEEEEDDDDSSSNDDDDDVDCSDADDDSDDEEENLPLMFYMYAKAQVEMGEHILLDKALHALKQAEASMLVANESLKTLKEKALKRPLNDAKVPPGSSLVKRSLSDERYQHPSSLYIDDAWSMGYIVFPMHNHYHDSLHHRDHHFDHHSISLPTGIYSV